MVSNIKMYRKVFSLTKAMTHITGHVPCVSFLARSDEDDYLDIVTTEPASCYVFPFGNSRGVLTMNLGRLYCMVMLDANLFNAKIS